MRRFSFIVLLIRSPYPSPDGISFPWEGEKLPKLWKDIIIDIGDLEEPVCLVQEFSLMSASNEYFDCSFS